MVGSSIAAGARMALATRRTNRLALLHMRESLEVGRRMHRIRKLVGGAARKPVLTGCRPTNSPRHRQSRTTCDRQSGARHVSLIRHAVSAWQRATRTRSFLAAKRAVASEPMDSLFLIIESDERVALQRRHEFARLGIRCYHVPSLPHAMQALTSWAFDAVLMRAP